MEMQMLIPGKQVLKRILIVEDDLCLQNVISRVMHAINRHIALHWVTTAEEALEALKDRQHSGQPYDLIVSDIFLSGETSGLDLWHKCQSQYANIPILLTSGMPVDQFLKEVGRDEICPPYLPKPFFTGECRQLIEGLLGYTERELRLDKSPNPNRSVA